MEENGLFAKLKTNRGEIIIKLEYELTPLTVSNFVTLTEGTNPYVSENFKNKKFYDGLTFHRVIDDFMIQGGDPTGTGSGGPGYKFKDEFVNSLNMTKLECYQWLMLVHLLMEVNFLLHTKRHLGLMANILFSVQ
tara:strand:+ start:88 stop:492 length:405 start_codon:yes stop_codon:yes gene_type:complete